MSEMRLVDLLHAVVRDVITQPSLPPGLTEAQWGALRYLANHRRSSLANAAEAMSMSRPAASRLYKRLVQHGWIERHVDPHDLRYIELDLTQEGGKLVDEIVQKRARQYEKIFADMSDKDQEQLTKGTRAFLAATLGVPSFDEDACLQCNAQGDVLCPAAKQVLEKRALI